jgi:hypothetical protein
VELVAQTVGMSQVMRTRKLECAMVVSKSGWPIKLVRTTSINIRSSHHTLAIARSKPDEDMYNVSILVSGETGVFIRLY